MLTTHQQVMDAVKQIDTIISEQETVCFDVRASEAITQMARVRRNQLIDLKALLEGRKLTLDS